MILTDEERRMIMGISDNIKYFNKNRRKGKLDVVVNNGNKADVLKDGVVILSCVTIEQAYAAIAAIINYENGGKL